MAEYIEREALRKSLLIGAAYLDEDTMMTVVNVLDCFPAADVAPIRRGRWVYPIGMAWNYVCSECGKSIGVIKHKYCPNCGCKMDLEG